MTQTPDNTVTILLAIITLIGTIATSIIAAIVAIQTSRNSTAIAETHKLVNGQTTALVNFTTHVAHAQGVVDGLAGTTPSEAIANLTLPIDTHPIV